MSRKKTRESDIPKVSLEQMRAEPGIATRTAAKRGPVSVVDGEGRVLGIVCVPPAKRPELGD